MGEISYPRWVQELRDGRCTGIAPDGPAGPPRVAKRGVGHIAAQTGVPIVPVRFGQPILVDERNFDTAMSELADLLQVAPEVGASRTVG